MLLGSALSHARQPCDGKADGEGNSCASPIDLENPEKAHFRAFLTVTV